jgi:hypothetical protein
MNNTRGFRNILILSIIFFLVIIQLTCSSSLPTITIESSVGPTQVETLQQTPIGLGFDKIDAAIKQSMQGNLAYNTPSTMKLYETKTIQLIMNPNMSPTALAGQISEGGVIITATINVTPRMKAELYSVDPDAFVIQPLHDNPEQLLSSLESTEWMWNVTAKKGGSHELSLVVYRLVEYNGKEYWRQVAYKSTIVIQVTLVQKIEQINWEWLIGIILTGLLIPAIWRYVDQRKKKNVKHKITDNKK